MVVTAAPRPGLALAMGVLALGLLLSADATNVSDSAHPPARPKVTDLRARPGTRGCMVPIASNYNPEARIHDRSCVYPILGCTNPKLLGYNPRANQDDGSCREPIRGCTHRKGTNFNQLATIDDGSCKYERLGCTRPTAPNYDPLAEHDDGSCGRDLVVGCTSSLARNYDPRATLDSGKCEFRVVGCMDSSAANFDPLASTPSNDCKPKVRGCMAPTALTYRPDATQHQPDACKFELPSRGVCKEAMMTAIKIDSSPQTRGSENSVHNVETMKPVLEGAAVALGIRREMADAVINSCISAFSPIPSETSEHALQKRRGLQQTTACNQQSVSLLEALLNRTVTCGCTDTRASNYDPTVDISDQSCLIQGCMDSAALNYDVLATAPGSCEYDVVGCLVPTAENYDSSATIDTNPTTCTFLVHGCTNPQAPNFISYAQKDDGSCAQTIPGCMDPLATNYNAFATQNRGCEYKRDGCTDESAINFDPLATSDDASCIAPQHGCTIQSTSNYAVFNYNPQANAYDGSCVFSRLGCMDADALNYDPFANQVDQAHACIAKVSGCTDPQALSFDTRANFLNADACTYPATGCTDAEAANHNPSATTDDGSCIFLGCTASTALNYNPGSTFDDGSCTFPQRGCTNIAADNFRSDAVLDDGSCIIPGCMVSSHPEYAPTATVSAGCPPVAKGCTDPEAPNFAPGAVVDDGSCSIAGCTDSTALNHQPLASFDDGTCQYQLKGCRDPRAVNYVSLAQVDDDAVPCAYGGCTDSFDAEYSSLATFNDGTCTARRGCKATEAAVNYDPTVDVDDGSCIILGCTLSLSPQFNAAANYYDGSCPEIKGCTDTHGENYASYANVDDGSCVVMGCTDSRFSSFNPDATTSDDSCGVPIFGCRDSNADNYLPSANMGGSNLCSKRGCMDSHASNFDVSANVHDYSCERIVPGCTASAARNYLQEATLDDGSCYILGCTNSYASNYNAAATVDDGTCALVDIGCADSAADNYEPAATAPSPSACIYVGCTDSKAPNFDPSATHEGGLCDIASPSFPPVPSPPPTAPPPRPFSDGSVDTAVTIGGTSVLLTPYLDAFDHFGSSLCSLGDIDGDLVTDLAIGARNTPFQDIRKVLGVGAIYVVSLATNGLPKSVAKISRGTSGFSAPLARYDYFGTSVSVIGDLNGDGCNELAVGAPGDDERASAAGAVYVIFMTPSVGSTSGCAVGDSLSVLGWQKISQADGVRSDGFGSALAAPGDLNGDGIPDLIVGAPGHKSSSGAIYLVSLNADGTSASSELLAPPSFGSAVPAGANFGFAIAVRPLPAGESGASSTIAVSAPMSGTGASGSGVVYILTLSSGSRRALQESGALPSGVDVLSTIEAPPSAQDGAFGDALAYVADYDGNESPELVVGAPNEGSGTVYLHFMDRAGTRAIRVVTISAVGDRQTEFGRAITTAGALNAGDIVPDLVIGARDDYPSPAIGSVTTLFMSATSPIILPPSPPPLGTPSPPVVPAVSLNENLSSDGSTNLRSGVLIGVWAAILVLVFLCGSWAAWFWYRNHRLSDLYKTKYLLGPTESIFTTVRDGRVTPSCRLEFRGSASARRASSVRSSAPDSMGSNPVPRQGAGASPILDPDVLLNVCYAPNVPVSSAPAAAAGPRSSSPRSSNAQAPRVVDLSQATDALLRGDGVPSDLYNPGYSQNVPTTLGALNTSARGREGANEPPAQGDGQDSQATWSADAPSEQNPFFDETPHRIPGGLHPREPGTDATLPSPREPSAALLRI